MTDASQDSRLKIVVTGGCGKIGSYFAKYAATRYQVRVIDQSAWDADALGRLEGESLVGSLQNMADCQKAVDGMDMVIHLAADPDPEADFLGSLLENNIVATYNMFRAAKEAGCKRFIFASSIHAGSAYAPDVQIRPEMPVRPGNLYGVSKAFGEALAAHFAYNEGLPAIAIRIGAYRYPNENRRIAAGEYNAYLNADDFNHLLTRCIETPDIQFLIAHGISNNRYKRVDLTETRQVLGYNPQVDVFEMAEQPGSEKKA